MKRVLALKSWESQVPVSLRKQTDFPLVALRCWKIPSAKPSRKLLPDVTGFVSTATSKKSRKNGKFFFAAVKASEQDAFFKWYTILDSRFRLMWSESWISQGRRLQFFVACIYSFLALHCSVIETWDGAEWDSPIAKCFVFKVCSQSLACENLTYFAIGFRKRHVSYMV